jgi:hypothetical protein
MAAVVIGGAEKELVSVLHDERCIRSMPRHKKKDWGATARTLTEEGLWRRRDAPVAREGSLGKGDAPGPARRGGAAVSRAVYDEPGRQKIELSGGTYRSEQRDGDTDETQGEGSLYSQASHKGNAGLRKGDGMARCAAARAGSGWRQSVACTQAAGRCKKGTRKKFVRTSLSLPR